MGWSWSTVVENHLDEQNFEQSTWSIILAQRRDDENFSPILTHVGGTDLSRLSENWEQEDWSIGNKEVWERHMWSNSY